MKQTHTPTRTRATPADIFRIWRELWGDQLPRSKPMSILQKTKNRYDRNPKDNGRDYDMALCANCSALIVYDAAGKSFCDYCGAGVDVVKVPQTQVDEFRQTMSNGQVMLDALLYGAALTEETDAEIEHIQNWLGCDVFGVPNEGTDTSMAAQLRDAGFGSSGPM